MKHAREDYNLIQDPEGLIGDDEPVFLLRAKDRTAPATLRFWADAQRIILGGDMYAADLADRHAEEMEYWQAEHGCKTADVPHNDTAAHPTGAAHRMKSEWVNFEKSGGPEMAGAYLVASAYTKDVGQARWMPRKKEWKWPNAAMAFEMTHWAHMPSLEHEVRCKLDRGA